MGISATVRLARTMPKKLTNASIYSKPVYCVDDPMFKGQTQGQPPLLLPLPDYMSTVKRMAELEERVNKLCVKPVDMPREKEELLKATISRVEALEQELIISKKVSSVKTPLFLFLCCIVFFPSDHDQYNVELTIGFGGNTG